MLPELEHVTPLELFRAVAPEGLAIPAALVVNHDAVLADRLAAGTVGTMPADFRVDEILGFYEAPKERAFKDCTDRLSWESSTDNNPVGANCPDPSTTLFEECRAGWQPPLVDDCDGLACTETYAPGPLAGFNQMRASVCMRIGVGDVRLHMGIKDMNQAHYTELFDTTLLNAGDSWYSNPVKKKHFWTISGSANSWPQKSSRRVSSGWSCHR